MKKIWLVVVILLVVALIWRTRPWWISTWQLSPQHTVDPAAITAEFDRVDRQAVFDNRFLQIPTSVFSSKEPNVKVLGDTSQAKRIEIDLTNQRLMAYEGDRQVYNFLISSGKWGRTPTGNFRIWIKLRYTKMEGGSKALNTYYYLPNVPYVMYFYNEDIPKWRGYGIHGTYWHDNFGHPMSHGCINMKTEEAGLLYQWANPDLGDKASGYAGEDNPGTEIIIYGTAPWE
jgi:lipoprotein-anchoring transpeptidase ErfK/SrfK